MNKIFLLILLSFSLLSSCKEKTLRADDKQKNTQTSSVDTIGQPIKEVQPDAQALWNQASAILKYRNENVTKKWAIIDVGVWQYDGIFKKGVMLKPEEVQGKWIDFDQSGKYEYGYKTTIQGKGNYHYDNDKSLLLLLNDDQKIKPEEYEVKLVNNFMIIQGTDVYKDNNFMAKLSKIEKRPS